MKEYKVVYYQSTLTLSTQKYTKSLTDFLNDYARQGWRVIESKDLTYFILEKDKNS